MKVIRPATLMVILGALVAVVATVIYVAITTQFTEIALIVGVPACTFAFWLAKRSV